MKKLVQELKDLVSIQSFSNNPAGVDKVGKYIRELLEDVDLEWTEYNSPTNKKIGKMLYAKSKKWDPKKPHILLNGHMDTVPIEDFKGSIKIKGDRLYGRGSNDMKVGLIIMIETLRRVQKEGKLENISITFDPDEETISTKHFPQLDKIVKDVTHLMVYEGYDDVVGGADMSYKKRTLVISRKGFIGGKILAKAAGGHCGLLKKEKERHSAVHELMNIGNSLLSLADYNIGTTMNIGKFNGGTAMNALAQHAEIEIAARMDTPEEFKRIFKSLNACKKYNQDKEVELICEFPIVNYPIPYTKQNKKFFEFAEKVSKKIGVEVEEEFRGGGSNANRIFYFNPNVAILDNLGGVGRGEHTDNEFVYLSSIEPNVKFSLNLIKSLLER